ncbi:MAG: hypothetical protein QXE51_03325 [Nitrososphaeria archaeon]
MEDATIVTCMGIMGIVVLGSIFFIFVRQDGTVLTSLSSIIGGLIGYQVGKKRR